MSNLNLNVETKSRTRLLANVLASKLYFPESDSDVLDLVAKELVSLRPDLTDLVIASRAGGETSELLERLADQDHVELPSHTSTGLAMAKFYAGQIVDELVSPYDGALAIWQEVSIFEEYDAEFVDLRIFAGLANQYEDFLGVNRGRTAL